MGPPDATYSVARAARFLGVHPNTVRAWSDQGRLRHYRINARGDRRYRRADLETLLAAVNADQPAVIHVSRSAGPIRPLPVGSLADETPGEAIATVPGLPPVEVSGRRRLRVLGRAADRLAADRLEADRQAGTSGDASDALELISGLAGASTRAGDLQIVLDEAVEALQAGGSYALVAVWERRGDLLVPRAAAGARLDSLPTVGRTFGPLAVGLTSESPRFETALDGAYGWLPVIPLGSVGLVAVPAAGGSWGVLLAAGDVATHDRTDGPLLGAVAAVVGAVVSADHTHGELLGRLRKAEALRRVGEAIGGELDPDEVLAELVEHALTMFAADRASVLLRQPDGSIRPAASRNLSPSFLAAIHDWPQPSVPAEAIEVGAPRFATAYRTDPRSVGVRAAVIQEGFDTIAAAPLVADDAARGVLVLFHDVPHPWSASDLDLLAAFGRQAAIAIGNAWDYARTARWAAQLQSIQHLGNRLNRLHTVREIGLAIASELGQLIELHNVRVYRMVDETELVPVAMRGEVGEYDDETPELLRTRVGEGITGWVAEHREAVYLPNALVDPRAQTIPGTDDIDESMLLAPMVYDEQCLGVLVLSRLGLDQFGDGDLRLLEIYANFAAQAMANADAAERLGAQSADLARQLRSRQALIHISESILATLEPRAVLTQITERLGELVRHDNVSIELWDPAAGVLRPLTARGLHAAEYLKPWEAGEEGLATWVVRHGIPQLVPNALADARVTQFAATGPLDGSLICVPLRGRDGVAGVLTVERLGADDRFGEEEFELVQLFAAQVSIALHNAEIYRDVEVRAQTDDLTGLLNQGTFHQWLAKAVSAREPFSLLLLDLDHFKEVNDRFGHQAGNELLRALSRSLVGLGREADRVFRYGGDEFVMLLPHTTSEGALLVAELVRAALAGVGVVEGRRTTAVEITASIGIATFPVDGATSEAILLAADRACYVAKRTGRNHIATAEDGRALAGEMRLQEPTPFDPNPATAPA